MICGQFLKDYYELIGNSMLAKVYGVYNIKLGDQKPFDIIMMANIVPP